ncbi:related to SNF1 protein kinase subunit beta-3 [Saccharomycodes ludwigii]|uniref:Related to SNF1 protein kinase subunit beta-3 n=1 Tax=Saccharomycodes ludwigii TaxID=36035 RepID=A0A376B3Q8_9ASCO|nr:related to SNF1 protein kinase subunit beta-3 [Saccharomycodes ludwigii]
MDNNNNKLLQDISMLDITENGKPYFNNKDGNDTNNDDSNNNNGNNTLLHQSLSQMSIDDNSDEDDDGLDHTGVTNFTRKKSTLIFNDDDDYAYHENVHGTSSSANANDEHIENVNSVSGLNINDNTSVSSSSSATSTTSYSATPPIVNQVVSDTISTSSSHNTVPNDDKKKNSLLAVVPVDIVWKQGGTSVYVTGSFTEWRKMIALVPYNDDNNNNHDIFHIVLQLPPGTHRFRFIVDGELRISDFLPQATDQMGNFVNFLEVVLPQQAEEQEEQQMNAVATKPTGSVQQLPTNNNNNRRNAYKIAGTGFTTLDQASSVNKTTRGKMSNSSRLALQIAQESENEPRDIGNGYSRVSAEETNNAAILMMKPKYEYTIDIPAVFTDPRVMEQYYLTLDQQRNNQQYMSWLTPPQLPPHLEKVILNQSPGNVTNSNNNNNNNNNNNTGSNTSINNDVSNSSTSTQTNENNSGALPIPNHVVLNHLITSSIKHNTLCVASTVRYKSKYATQILYGPLQ